MPYEPPKYPAEIPSLEDLPDRIDDVDWLYAARYNELKKELRAALIELGVLPKGSHADVKTRLDAIEKQSGCKASIILSPEIPSGTWQKINFNYKWWDKNDEYDEITTYRFTAKKAGIYSAIANITWLEADVEANVLWGVRIKHSGAYSFYKFVHSSVADKYITVTANAEIDMAADEHLEVEVIQYTGNVIKLQVPPWFTHFTVTKLTP